MGPVLETLVYRRKEAKQMVKMTLEVEGMSCGKCESDINAKLSSDNCPFLETITFCSNCKVHCYKPEMRQRIREVMRFSGPRMIFFHPVMAVQHVLATKREMRKLKREKEQSCQRKREIFWKLWI